MTDRPDRAALPAGRVGRPHGLDGSFHVTRPEPRLLAQGRTVLVGDRSLKIARRSGTDEHPIVRLAGIDAREAAAALRGSDLLSPRADAPPLEAGEYWAEDLVGCTVVAADRVLGTVDGMRAYPSCELLEVGDHLIPLVRDAVRSVDLEARRIEVDARFLGIEA